MSLAARDWAKRQKAGGVAAKAVLMALAEYADDTGFCWPAQVTIAEETELTDRSVRDQLVKLETAGLISREEFRRRDGTQGTDRIRLKMSDSRNVLPDIRNVVPVEQPERPSKQPEPRSALTTFEPPLEPPEEKEPVASAAPNATCGKPKADPWQNDEAFNALWTACTAEMRRRAKSRAKVWPDWVKAKRTADPAVILAGMGGYLASDPDVKRTGGPGLHIWLKDRTWELWCENSATPAASWSDEEWSAAVEIWRADKRWTSALGPQPGMPGCRVPSHLLINTAERVVA